MPTAEIITFGCRLNAFEAEVMRAHARSAGPGELVVVNTCAVTEEAMRQAGQAIRKARRERPQARIVVTGCAAQIEPERFAVMPEVTAVLGNAEKMRASSWSALAGHDDAAPRVRVGDIMRLAESAHHLIDGFASRARAYVEIQNGCDHRCTFCVIPFGRGPSRSVPAADVVAQVHRLTENGYREVVLTGVDITSWGADLGLETRLGDLVRQVLREVPDLARLRLSSIDSIEADAALLRAVAEEPRLMPHLHLSLQAGDDLVLKRMKRRHRRADAIAFCDELRRLRGDIVFGADLIAGFPTETEAMFAASEQLVGDCGLTFLHVFPYSARPGTPAARMPQVARDVVKARAARLRSKGEAVLSAYLERQHGCEVDVLLERDGVGRTPQFAEIRLATGAGHEQAEPEQGEIVRARVTGVAGARLTGEALA